MLQLPFCKMPVKTSQDISPERYMIFLNSIESYMFLCYIIDIKGTTAHGGLTNVECRNTTPDTRQSFKGGFSMRN